MYFDKNVHKMIVRSNEDIKCPSDNNEDLQ
jgi:hypothetical protein